VHRNFRSGTLAHPRHAPEVVLGMISRGIIAEYSGPAKGFRPEALSGSPP
jgi:hypothetical protein